MRPVPQRLEVDNQLTESPAWNGAEQALYWLDVPLPRLYRWKLEGAELSHWMLAEPVSAFAFTANGDLVVTPRWGFARYRLGERDFTCIAAPELGSSNRFNDGAVDPKGRFWACTLNEVKAPTNTLCCLNPDGKVSHADRGFRAGNGIAWNAEGSLMYLVDSGDRTIYRYAFDADSGRLDHRSAWVRFSAQDGVPDGIAADVEGNIWCALWSGGQVVRLSPAGNVIDTVLLPVSHPTSCAFGGLRLSTLFVTTAKPPTAPKTRPGDGDIYHLEVEVPGVPVPLYGG